MGRILDTQGNELSPPEHEAPAWASDPLLTVPIAVFPIQNSTTHQHKLILGEVSKLHVAVLCDGPPQELPFEELVGIAAGSWRAICGAHCGRELAEVIAKGWMSCARSVMN